MRNLFLFFLADCFFNAMRKKYGKAYDEFYGIEEKDCKDPEK